MRASILVGLALCASLAACGTPVENAAQARNTNSEAKMVDLAGHSARCVPASKMGLTSPTNELVGDLRSRMLTTEASLARVRVFTADYTVTNYGTTTVVYTNETADCVLWAETLGLQEMAERLGLTPLGLSPHYKAEAPKTQAPKADATQPPKAEKAQ